MKRASWQPPFTFPSGPAGESGPTLSATIPGSSVITIPAARSTGTRSICSTTPTPRYLYLANGHDTTGYSVNIQTDFLASHVWAGILSTYKRDIGEHFKLTAGFHGRLFQSTLQQKVRDLLGGEFYIDDYDYAIDGDAEPGGDQARGGCRED